MGQGGVKVLAQVFRLGIEIGKGIVIAVVERQTLAVERIEIPLIAAWFNARDKHFGIFEPHIQGYMRNVLPAPTGVLENRQVNTLLLEVTKATLDRGWHHHKAIIRLDLVQRRQQLIKQTGGLALFSFEHVRREIHSGDTHILCSHKRPGQQQRQAHAEELTYRALEEPHLTPTSLFFGYCSLP